MVLLLFVLVGVLCQEKIRGGVRIDSSGELEYFEVTEDNISELNLKSSVCSGVYTKKMMEEGWDYLTLSTNNESGLYTDTDKAHCVGMLEGKLTYQAIKMFYDTFVTMMFSQSNFTIPENVKEFFTLQAKYAEEEVKKYEHIPFYHYVGLMNTQIEGMRQGYNEEAVKQGWKELSYIEFITITSMGDIMEVFAWKNPNLKPFKEMTSEEIERHFIRSTHCSALWTVVGDFEDFYFGHNTWNAYASMLRIYKIYDFSFTETAVANNYLTFSSYPGCVQSTDDFYIVEGDNGQNVLAVIETTNGIFNEELYKLLDPKTFMYWQRIMVANRVAKSPKEWMELFGTKQSGTYNDQWMVADLKKFVPGKGFEEEAFFVGEQIPGEFYYEDRTKQLQENRYHPSYNVPMYKHINEKMGYPEQEKAHPELFPKIDYEHCARANIFRRDHAKIKTDEDMKFIMRYNDYVNDPLSLDDPALSIASRFEYSSNFTECHGAVDAKFSSWKNWMNERSVNIVAGPTKSSGETPDIPAFSWNDPKVLTSCPPKEFIHPGQPDVFDFDWVVIKPEA